VPSHVYHFSTEGIFLFECLILNPLPLSKKGFSTSLALNPGVNLTCPPWRLLDLQVGVLLNELRNTTFIYVIASSLVR